MKLLILILSISSVFATLPDTTVFEIRSTGASTNGGGFNAARGGVDYTLQDAPQISGGDGSASGTTTFTSALSTFTDNMKGNVLHLTGTGTGLVTNWYEIVSVTDANNVVLDATPGTGTGGIFTVGGAHKLGDALDDDFFEIAQPKNKYWMKTGAYTLGEGVNIAKAGTSTNMIQIEGYNTTRGDLINSKSNRPEINTGASLFFLTGTSWWLKNLVITGAGTSVGGTGSGSAIYNCAFKNTSQTAARPACSIGANNSVRWSEFTSQNGNGITGTPSASIIFGCLIAHNNNGASLAATTSLTFERCLFLNNTVNITGTTFAQNSILYSTFYGASATPRGIGFQSTGSSAANNKIYGNLFFGLATAIEIANVLQDSIIEDWNCFNNNTTDRTLCNTGTHSITNDPSFAGASQITGSTATTATTVLTQSGGDFSSVTVNSDYVRIISGTGVTVGNYLITAATGTTLTVNGTLGTSSAGDVVYVVYTGNNYAPTATLTGFPGTLLESTGYPIMGAFQPVASAAAGEYSTSFTSP